MLRASSVYSMFTVGGWRGDSPFPEKEIQVRSTTFIQRSLGSNFNFTSTVVWLASNREPTSVSCTTFRNAESAWRSSLAPCGTSSKVGARHGPACHVWLYFQPPTAVEPRAMRDFCGLSTSKLQNVCFLAAQPSLSCLSSRHFFNTFSSSK